MVLLSKYNPKCRACGREYQDTDMRVEYFVQLGMTLCQNPAYVRGKSDEPGCMDKITDRAREWADSEGQQKVGDFV